MREETAREILERMEPIFRERNRILTELAVRNPCRLPPNKRTWQDWEELRRRTDVGIDPTYLRWLNFAMDVAPDLETCEAILRGESVPASRLDRTAARSYGLDSRART